MRLPRGDWAARQAQKEHRWLPELAPRLPIAIPAPVGLGHPDLGYPWHWSVSRWLEGTAAVPGDLADPVRTGIELAGFLVALRSLPCQGMRERAGVLAERDASTRRWIAETAGTFDAAAMTAVWDAAMAVPAWERDPVWCHGDMHNGNLLTVDGRVSAVIDFGGLAVGDPSCDLVIAWTLLDGDSREAFREAVRVDDATWVRGRAWALTTGLSAYTAYASVRPDVAAATTRQILAALAG